MIFILLCIRDVYIIIIGVYLVFSQDEIFQSNLSGKWFIGISTLMMALFIFQDGAQIPVFIPWLTYVVSVILFIVSTIEYFKRYLHYFSRLGVK